jgi:hypothetical protein
MISAKVTKNFDLRKINLDLHRDINKGIKIIAEDIERGIDNGSQFGKRFKDIDEKTAKRKGHNRPLIDKGVLKNPDKMQVTLATTAKQEATILPAPEREDVSFWNHFGTDNIDAREHWGVSDRAFKKIIFNMENTIRKSIDRIRRARVA